MDDTKEQEAFMRAVKAGKIQLQGQDKKLWDKFCRAQEQVVAGEQKFKRLAEKREQVVQQIQAQQEQAKTHAENWVGQGVAFFELLWERRKETKAQGESPSGEAP